MLSGISLAILPPTQRHALIEALIYYQARGGIVAYDSNHRPKLWESPEIARETNAVMWDFAMLALPSVDDEMHIFQRCGCSGCSCTPMQTWTAYWRTETGTPWPTMNWNK